MKIISLLFLISFIHPLFSQTNINWAKSYGSEFDERGCNLIETYDGNLLLAGVKEIPGEDTEVLIYKLDLEGNVVWENNILFSNANILIFSLTYTADNNGYILSGVHNSNSNTDYLVIKIDNEGNKLWSKTYGGSGYDYLQAVVPNGSGYILAGFSSSTNGDVTDHIGQYDYWLAWIDSEGILSNAKSYGGNQSEQLGTMIKTSDGKLVLSGHSHSFINHGFQADFWVVKTEITGEVIWSYSYGGTGADFSPYIIEVDEGDLIVAGESGSNDYDIPMDNHGDSDFFACRITQNGTVVWAKSYGGTGWENLYAIENSLENSFFLGGFTRSNDGDITNGHNGGANDYWVVQINKSDGLMIWQDNFGGSGEELLHDLLVVDSILYVGGISYSNDFDINGDHIGGSDFWILKHEEINTTIDYVFLPEIKILQNPVYDYLNFETDRVGDRFRIINLSGNEILAGKFKTQINVKDIPSGIYFIEIFNDFSKTFCSAKFVKI